MSNTVKIKNRKKKKEIKVNYRLWAIVFGVFVALIVGLAVWASFHWGVGMGSIGAPKDDAGEAATEAAAESATSSAVTLTPEQLEQMGITVEDDENALDVEADDKEDGAAKDAAKNAAAEDGAAKDAAAEDGAAKDAAKNAAAEDGAAKDAAAKDGASQDAGAQGQ